MLSDRILTRCTRTYLPEHNIYKFVFLEPTVEALEEFFQLLEELLDMPNLAQPVCYIVDLKVSGMVPILKSYEIIRQWLTERLPTLPQLCTAIMVRKDVLTAVAQPMVGILVEKVSHRRWDARMFTQDEASAIRWLMAQRKTHQE